MGDAVSDMFPDLIEYRVVEYRKGCFAPVVARQGKWEFTGGRVYYSAESAAEAAAAEVDFLRRYWAEQLAERKGAVVIEGAHYRLGDRDSSSPRSSRGFGGRTFYMRDLSTGEITTCSDLWEQGRIPDFARPHFPDTHEWVVT